MLDTRHIWTITDMERHPFDDCKKLNCNASECYGSIQLSDRANKLLRISRTMDYPFRLVITSNGTYCLHTGFDWIYGIDNIEHFLTIGR